MQKLNAIVHQHDERVDKIASRNNGGWCGNMTLFHHGDGSAVSHHSYCIHVGWLLFIVVISCIHYLFINSDNQIFFVFLFSFYLLYLIWDHFFLLGKQQNTNSMTENINSNYYAMHIIHNLVILTMSLCFVTAVISEWCFVSADPICTLNNTIKILTVMCLIVLLHSSMKQIWSQCFKC